MTSNELLKPTSVEDRIELMDGLRGFALFGIMFVNMTWFTGFAVLSIEQRLALGTAEIDSLVYWLINVLFDGKFWAMFAFLFGAGAAMQHARCVARREPFKALFVRRINALFAIGILHAVLLWFGDIVSLYAVVGYALLLFVGLSDRSLLLWGLLLLLVPVFHSGIWQWLNPDFDTRHGPYEQLGSFANGTIDQVFATNWAFLVKRWILAVHSGRFYQLLGLFLLGYWAAGQGIFRSPDKHLKLLKNVLIYGLLVGLPANVFLVSFEQPTTQLAGWISNTVRSIGIPVLSFAYVAGFILLYQKLSRTSDQTNSNGIAAVLSGMWICNQAGRMTLTNYIMQSLIGCVLFYGIGFGFWGQIGITWAIVLIFLIFVFQALVSAAWLQWFRQGPLEWLWRCITYGQILPAKRQVVLIKSNLDRMD